MSAGEAIVRRAGGFQEVHKFWWGFSIALGAILLLWLVKELADYFAVLSSNRRGANSLKVVPSTRLRRSREDAYLLRGHKPGLPCLVALH